MRRHDPNPTGRVLEYIRRYGNYDDNTDIQKLYAFLHFNLDLETISNEDLASSLQNITKENSKYNWDMFHRLGEENETN